MKKATPKYQQSSPSHGQSITTPARLVIEHTIVALLAVALFGLVWFCEVAA